jgi:hypothetical protein
MEVTGYLNGYHTSLLYSRSLFLILGIFDLLLDEVSLLFEYLMSVLGNSYCFQVALFVLGIVIPESAAPSSCYSSLVSPCAIWKAKTGNCSQAPRPSVALSDEREAVALAQKNVKHSAG